MAGESYWSPATRSESTSLGAIFSLVLVGAMAGAAVTFRVVASAAASESANRESKEGNQQRTRHCSCDSATKRERLPLLVILVRHGESEGNVDHKAWWRKADHDIELTETGKQQAARAGEQIENIFRKYDKNDNDNKNSEACCRGGKQKIRHVHLHVSPFERTKQTALHARPFFDHRVTHYKLCPRLREQEFGNLQNQAVSEYRKQQKMVGRFWYRFPTGESGADVLARVRSWWVETLLPVNLSHDRCPDEEGTPVLDDHYVDAVVVFSHGLTIRSILCQLFKWSIYTYHSVYNAGNGDVYVLKRDLDKPGRSPYVLDGVNGKIPTSSVDVCVTFSRTHRNNNDNDNKSDGEPSSSKTQESNDSLPAQKQFKLKEYLSIPAPRRNHIQEIKDKLVELYPEDFPGGSEDIESISFMSFSSGAVPPQLPGRGSPDQQLRERNREGEHSVQQ